MTAGTVLWVTSEPPNDQLGGGSIRQSQLLRRLAGHVEVDLLVLGGDTDAAVRRRVREVIEVEPPPVAPPPGRAGRAVGTVGVLGIERSTVGISTECRRAAPLADEARRLEAGYDVVVAQHQALAPAVPSARRARWVLQMHHVPSARSAQRAAHEPRRRRRLVHRLEARNAARWLDRWLPRWDRVVTVSEDDARLLGLAPEDVAVSPNGVDLAAFAPTPRPAGGTVLLTASLDYHPNVDGAVWFVERVWPLVRRRHPDLELELVGRSPAPEVLDLAARPGVSVHADVPAIPPWLARASVVVVPLRIGTGTRLKALEALAAGRPLVGTSVGLEGLGIRDREHALVADDTESFAAAVIEVVEGPDTADRIAGRGRQLVEERFGWDGIAERFVSGVL